MTTQKSKEEYIQEAEIMYQQHFAVQLIEEHLEKNGADEETIREVRRQLYKHVQAKKRKTGLIFVVIGVILLGMGFLSSLGMFYSGGEFNFALYGFTMAGLIVMFIGLVQIF